MTQSPAGWYPQPDGSQRYWDGTAWTSHTAPAAQPPPPPYGAPVGGYGQQYGQQYGYPVAPKNPAISLLVSFFVPGVGSMINGDVGIGVAILIGYLISFPLVLVVVGLPMLLGFWVWGMVDAYQGAVRWNRAHGIIS